MIPRAGSADLKPIGYAIIGAGWIGPNHAIGARAVAAAEKSKSSRFTVL